MNPAQRLPGDKAAQRLMTQREFSQRERPFLSKAPVPQALQVLRRVVFRPIDEAQILRSPAFDRWLIWARSVADKVDPLKNGLVLDMSGVVQKA